VASLSTFYTPQDVDRFPQSKLIVDTVGIGEQHPVRRWEYTIALEAIRQWKNLPAQVECGCQSFTLVDVGGAGSRFVRMAQALGIVGRIIDPNANGDSESAPQTIAQYLGNHPPLSDIVTCLSVLEHVDDLDQTLYHLGCLVRPGGLLVLTVDACEIDTDHSDVWPDDTYHFHWMRNRIFGRRQLAAMNMQMGLREFGSMCDYVWPGYTDLYNYGAASLVLTKRA
jgi:hypothetical protein